MLGGITVGYGWVVARHLGGDARQTSALLGRVVARRGHGSRLAGARARVWLAREAEGAPPVCSPRPGVPGWAADDGEVPGTAGPERADRLQADAKPLERVVVRFARIGRPARRE